MANKPAAKVSKEAAKESPKALYEVMVNGGNDPSTTISSLDELGEIAERKLVDDQEHMVQLRVKPIMVPGKFAAERADGVKMKLSPVQQKRVEKAAR
ncbi:MAG TPA: hypothetical protein VGA18_02150 [Rhodothermales bacterium]